MFHIERTKALADSAMRGPGPEVAAASAEAIVAANMPWLRTFHNCLLPQLLTIHY